MRHVSPDCRVFLRTDETPEACDSLATLLDHSRVHRTVRATYTTAVRTITTAVHLVTERDVLAISSADLDH